MRWRRRRLARLRRRVPRQVDDHTWDVKPLKSKESMSVPLPAGTQLHASWGQIVLPGTPVVLNIGLDISIVGMGSLRTCRVCGQDSIDGKLPKLSCREKAVSDVMEA